MLYICSKEWRRVGEWMGSMEERDSSAEGEWVGVVLGGRGGAWRR